MTSRSRNCRFGTRAARGGMLKRLCRPLTLVLLLSGALPAHAGEMLADARVIRSVSHGQPFAREVNAAGRLVGIDPALLRAVVVQESSGNPNAVSEAGAVGLTQLMPVAIRQYTGEAARLLGHRVNARSAFDNLLMGACYYRDALRRTHGNVEAAPLPRRPEPGDARPAHDGVRQGHRMALSADDERVGAAGGVIHISRLPSRRAADLRLSRRAPRHPPPPEPQLDRVERLRPNGVVAGVRADDDPAARFEPIDLERLELWLDEPEVRYPFTGVDPHLSAPVDAASRGRDHLAHPVRRLSEGRSVREHGQPLAPPPGPVGVEDVLGEA